MTLICRNSGSLYCSGRAHATGVRLPARLPTCTPSLACFNQKKPVIFKLGFETPFSFQHTPRTSTPIVSRKQCPDIKAKVSWMPTKTSQSDARTSTIYRDIVGVSKYEFSANIDHAQTRSSKTVQPVRTFQETR